MLISTRLYFTEMPAVIAMLRAVNLVSHNRIKMDALCSLCSR